MVNILIFNALLVVVALLALWRGGLPERIAAAALVLAALATRIAYSPVLSQFQGVEYGVFGVDVALVVTLGLLALRANRLWPMCLTSLHLASVLVHVGRLIEDDMAAWAYAFMLKIWAYPMLAVLLVGVERHRRRLARVGVDEPWS
jgi:hypothetical protein